MNDSEETADDNAFAECLSLLDHMDHICEEVSSLHSKLVDMEYSIVQQVSAEIKSSLPAFVNTALKEQLHGLLSATLKDCLPLIIKESLQTRIPASNRFVTLQKELSKVLKSKVAKSVIEKVQVVGLEGVREDLHSQTKHLTKYCLSFQNMQTQLLDVKDLLESVVIIDETAKGEKKKKDENGIPAPTQGEHETVENITPSELIAETQGELAYKESTLPVSKTKVNEETVMVLHELEKKDLVDLTTTKQDSEDDDDLDKQPLSERFKTMHLIPNIPVPLLQLSVEQFTNQLFGTTSSKFSPTPPREPTPPRDEYKGKGIATEESLKDIMPFMKEGGLVPKISSLKSFVLPKGPLSQEKVMDPLKEMKRLADLKEHEKKSEEELKKMLNPATLKAQTL
ncbi:hypothetical protein Tco_1035826, partial [Tanacetum coccineum]